MDMDKKLEQLETMGKCLTEKDSSISLYTPYVIDSNSKKIFPKNRIQQFMWIPSESEDDDNAVSSPVNPLSLWVAVTDNNNYLSKFSTGTITIDLKIISTCKTLNYFGCSKNYS